jgi:hypothetical protein
MMPVYAEVPIDYGPDGATARTVLSRQLEQEPDDDAGAMLSSLYNVQGAMMREERRGRLATLEDGGA